MHQEIKYELAINLKPKSAPPRSLNEDVSFLGMFHET